MCSYMWHQLQTSFSFSLRLIKMFTATWHGLPCVPCDTLADMLLYCVEWMRTSSRWACVWMHVLTVPLMLGPVSQWSCDLWPYANYCDGPHTSLNGHFISSASFVTNGHHKLPQLCQPWKQKRAVRWGALHTRGKSHLMWDNQNVCFSFGVALAAHSVLTTCIAYVWSNAAVLLWIALQSYWVYYTSIWF